MAVWDRLARVLVVIALPLALLLAPMYPLITPAFVRHEYGQPGFPAATRYDNAERLAISDPILAYLRGQLSRDALATVRTRSGEIALNAREVGHLVDVRVVMDALFRVQQIATLGAIIPIAALGVRGRRRALGRSLRQGVAVTGVLIAAIVGFALIDFDTFFTAFHGLFFRSGTWTFDWTDTLIQLYPLLFWVDTVWKYGALAALGLAVVFLLGGFLVRRGDAPVAGAAEGEVS